MPDSLSKPLTNEGGYSIYPLISLVANSSTRELPEQNSCNADTNLMIHYALVCFHMAYMSRAVLSAREIGVRSAISCLRIQSPIFRSRKSQA